MKIGYYLAIAFSLACGPSCANDLWTEIKGWKSGQEIPPRLLSYPDGDVPSNDPNFCGFASYMESVRPYIDSLENDALIEAIAFDQRASHTSFHAAATRLVERKGLNWLAKRLERDRTRWEHEAFRQMLQSRFAHIAVAFIEVRYMEAPRAESELKKLLSSLDAGMSWKEAYGEFSEQHPNVERRKLQPEVPTTIVTYLYEGWISEIGFDFTELGVAYYFPGEHLNLVRSMGAKSGKIVSSPLGSYLFYAFEVYEPKTPN